MFYLEHIFVYRHALRRSRVRVEVLLALLRNDGLSLADLVRSVGAYRRNVQGALRGDRDAKHYRYRHDESLVALGFVGSELVERVEVFKLTPHGHAVAKRLKAELDEAAARKPLLRP